MLLLTTLGRRSGQRRVTPLLYVEDGARFAVVASNAGDDRNPAWLLNLRKQPAAEIQIGTQHIRVQAREATDSESERLWPKLRVFLLALPRLPEPVRGDTSRWSCSNPRGTPRNCDPDHQTGPL